MFDELVKNSRRFLESGIKGQVMNGTIDHATHFGFFVKKYWQGTYDRYIQVKLKGMILFLCGIFNPLLLLKALLHCAIFCATC